jgi:hypothetical protein
MMGSDICSINKKKLKDGQNVYIGIQICLTIRNTVC